MPPLLLGIDFKRVTIIGLGAGLVILLLFTKAQQIELDKARLVYEHPQQQVRIVRKTVAGPVRIRVVEREYPDGRRERETQEDRGEVVTTEGSETNIAPVPLAIALAAPRTDRYLVTFGVNQLSLDPDGKALFVGYGFRNRLDVQVGGVYKEHLTPWALVTVRF